MKICTALIGCLIIVTSNIYAITSDSLEVVGLAKVETHNETVSKDLFIAPPINTNQDYHGVISHANYMDASIEESNKTPFFVSLNAEKRLNRGAKKRFSLGTGIGLLRLKSELIYPNSYLTTHQKITRNYLAIPLYVKYDYLMDNRVKLYASFGISSEFGLGGKSVKEDYSNEELVSSETENFDLSIGQFNLNIGSGINVKLSKRINLYAEASAAHYFYQTRSTLWSENCLWFSMKTGVGFQF